MRLAPICLMAVAACGPAAGYRLSSPERYEVGDDATITVDGGGGTEVAVEVVIIRPDASVVREPARLGSERIRVRFSGEPRGPATFNQIGDYRIELRSGDRVLAKHEIRVSVDRLDELLPAKEVAGYAPISRATRSRQHGTRRWKTYEITYRHPWRTGAEVEILIEEPKAELESAWQRYIEEGTLGVIENNNVRFRERSDSASASWIAGKRIVAVRSATLADLERGLIGHFLARFPSDLRAE